MKKKIIQHLFFLGLITHSCMAKSIECFNNNWGDKVEITDLGGEMRISISAQKAMSLLVFPGMTVSNPIEIKIRFSKSDCYENGDLLSCFTREVPHSKITLINSNQESQEVDRLSVSFNLLQRAETTVTSFSKPKVSNSIVGRLNFMGWDSSSNLFSREVEARFLPAQCKP